MQQPLTIVSGLPRSGTSMMMQLLAAGGVPILTDNVRRADEDNPKGYYEFEPVKTLREDSSWVAGAGGKGVKMVYRLLYDLPEGYPYRVIFMRRTLDEVIRSQDEMLRRLGVEDGDPDDGKLAGVYRRELRDVEAWLKTRPNFEVLYVDFHDILDDTEAVVRQVNRLLGGGLDTAAMLRVPDRSLYRQRV